VMFLPAEEIITRQARVNGCFAALSTIRFPGIYQ
jgi:hypothetical protein